MLLDRQRFEVERRRVVHQFFKRIVEAQVLQFDFVWLLLGDADLVRDDADVTNEAVLSDQDDGQILGSRLLGELKHDLIVEIRCDHEVEVVLPISLQVVCNRLHNKVTLHVIGVELQEVGTHDLRSRLTQVIWTKEEVLSQVSLGDFLSIDDSERSNLGKNEVLERLAA